MIDDITDGTIARMVEAFGTQIISYRIERGILGIIGLDFIDGTTCIFILLYITSGRTDFALDGRIVHENDP